MTGLKEQLADYLTMRRALGYKLTHHARRHHRPLHATVLAFLESL